MAIASEVFLLCAGFAGAQHVVRLQFKALGRAPMRLRQQRHYRRKERLRSLRAREAAHARRKPGVFAFGRALPKLARLCSVADAA